MTVIGVSEIDLKDYDALKKKKKNSSMVSTFVLTWNDLISQRKSLGTINVIYRIVSLNSFYLLIKKSLNMKWVDMKFKWSLVYKRKECGKNVLKYHKHILYFL